MNFSNFAKATLSVTLVASGLAQAQGRPLSPARELRIETENLLHLASRGDRLDPASVERALQLVLQAQEEISGRGRRVKACDSDDIDQLSRSVKIIRDFAYNGNGLNMSSTDSSAYAQAWVTEYPCAATNAFVAAGTKLRAMAYSGRGLNMSSTDSSAFTQAALRLVCDADVDFVTEGAKIYDYAYSGGGLNLSSSEASAYTKKKIEERHLTCERDNAFKRRR